MSAHSGVGGCCCVYCMPTSMVGIMQRFGKFTRIAPAGITCVYWPVETLKGLVSLRVQQLDVTCETKTKDNVFVNTVVSVQYQVVQERVFDAFYKLTDPKQQITSYVYDVVRSTLPTMDLDQAFEAKDEIAISVRQSLESVMGSFGYRINQALVTDLTPNDRVRNAMNEINASKRLKEAASEKAEATKILIIKAAEADAEAKYLSGYGVARQRSAIINGLRESIVEFEDDVDGASSKDVMDLLLMTQYLDMLSDVGNNKKTATVFTGQSTKQIDSLRDGLLQANAQFTEKM